MFVRWSLMNSWCSRCRNTSRAVNHAWTSWTSMPLSTSSLYVQYARWTKWSCSCSTCCLIDCLPSNAADSWRGSVQDSTTFNNNTFIIDYYQCHTCVFLCWMLRGRLCDCWHLWWLEVGLNNPLTQTNPIIRVMMMSHVYQSTHKSIHCKKGLVVLTSEAYLGCRQVEKTVVMRSLCWYC